MEWECQELQGFREQGGRAPVISGLLRVPCPLGVLFG